MLRTKLKPRIARSLKSRREWRYWTAMPMPIASRNRNGCFENALSGSVGFMGSAPRAS
jgi:hypothetical protein